MVQRNSLSGDPKIIRATEMGNSVQSTPRAYPASPNHPAEPAAFLTAVAKSTRATYLTKHTAESLQATIDAGGIVRLSEDGTSGYILTANGDLQNAFNAGGPPGAGQRAVIDAIANGAQNA